MKFEWDERKNQSNVEKHGVNFEDAKELFDSKLYEYEDTRINYGEKRMIGYGFIHGKLMAVAYAPRHNVIRLISFRRANSREEVLYEQNFKST